MKEGLIFEISRSYVLVFLAHGGFRPIKKGRLFRGGLFVWEGKWD
jgi:hypothetical protein